MILGNVNSERKQSFNRTEKASGRFISQPDYDKVREIVKTLQNENTLLKKKLASQKYEIRGMKKEQIEYKKICKEFKQMDPSTINLNIKVTTLQNDIKRLTELLSKTSKLKELGKAINAKENLHYLPPNKNKENNNKKLSRNCSKTRNNSRNRSLSKNNDKLRTSGSNKNFLRVCCNEEEQKDEEICKKKFCFKEMKDWVPGECKKLALLFKKKFMPKVIFFL